MSYFKRTTVLVLTLLLLSAFLPLVPQSRAWDTAEAGPERSSDDNEIVLDGHKIVNMLDDFLAFWDASRGKSARRQRQLWTRNVEDKYRDFFERAVYRNADPDTRLAMLNRFLSQPPDRIEAIRQFNATASSQVIESIMQFKAQFPDYHQRRDIYIGLSLLSFDGTVRSVGNDLGVPDTLCLGADVLANYQPMQAKIVIAHEFFHLYHFGFLFGGMFQLYYRGLIFRQGALASLSAAHVPLMAEGMAVAASEAVCPGQPLAMYLHLPEDELAVQKEELAQSSLQFLGLIRQGALPEQYEQWFANGSFEGVPRRGGYLLGYEVTRHALATSTLEDMVRMSSAQLAEQAEEQLSTMSTEKVLLMASGN
jgi:hypothetical protein